MVITRQTKLTAGALAVAVVVVLLSTVIFDMSIERAVLLAPVLVIGAGVIVGLVVFWAKVAMQQWRGEDGPDGDPVPGGGRHPKRTSSK